MKPRTLRAQAGGKVSRISAYEIFGRVQAFQRLRNNLDKID